MPERISNQKATEAYVKDMAKYSIVSNWTRNIPDIKDGLKPVQRRILFCMDKNEHAISIPSKVKCAAIVGSVMKLYHPHGDCIHMGTPIYGLDGKVYTIGDLTTEGRSLEILAIDQNTGNVVPAVAHSFRIGKYTDEIYHIQLSNGTEIQCTSNHPFMMHDRTWIIAENIKRNTLLLTTLMSSINRPIIGETSQENISNYKNVLGFDNTPNDINLDYHSHSPVKFAFVKIFRKVLLSGYDLTFENYKLFVEHTEIMNVQDFEFCLNEFVMKHPFVVNVWIEKVNQEPMFDFTVDGHENMLIPAVGPDNVNTSTIPFICIHNSSIYDAMKPLSNWFECKSPLIQPGGSFGNIMGGRASAMRYTEANLTAFTMECLIGGLHSSAALVDWVDNYNNTTKEPQYLPATVPLLLINGASGIGVGMKVDIPSHNLSEVVDATIRLIDNPNCDIILTPDHCINCDIIDTDWKAICNTGNGSYRARGHIVIDEVKDGKFKGNPEIRIKSLPVYNTINITTQIEKLITDGKFPQIVDVLDGSKTSIDIHVILKKGTDVDFVKEAIYKYTDVERSFQINFEVINGIERMRMSYKSYLEAFIQFAMTNKFRFYYDQLVNINTRMHKLDAFIKVLKSGYINDIIKLIQKKNNTDDHEIIEFLIKKANITDLQAEYIINASIKQLSLGYLHKYEDEFNVLNEKMIKLESSVTNDNLIKDAIRQDLLDAKAKYGTPRLCKIIKVSNYGNVPQGSFKLVVTENNYVRKLSINDIVNVIKGDRPKFIMNVENTENVLLFDNKGRVFKLPVHKIPIVGKSDAGIDIRSSLKGLTADIISIIYEPVLKSYLKSKTKCYVAVLSKNNIIKKLDLSDFLSVPPSGIIYSKLNIDDTVIAIDIIWDHLDIVIYSGHKALRISAKDIPCYKRNTLGIAAMNTTDDVEGMSIIFPEATDIVVVTTSGRVNRFMVSGLARTSRYKTGSAVIKLKGDSIQSIFGTSADRTLNIVTTSDTISLPVSSIQLGSSISTGIKAVSTKSDVIIKSEIV